MRPSLCNTELSWSVDGVLMATRDEHTAYKLSGWVWKLQLRPHKGRKAPPPTSLNMWNTFVCFFATVLVVVRGQAPPGNPPASGQNDPMASLMGNAPPMAMPGASTSPFSSFLSSMAAGGQSPMPGVQNSMPGGQNSMPGGQNSMGGPFGSSMRYGQHQQRRQQPNMMRYIYPMMMMGDRGRRMAMMMMMMGRGKMNPMMYYMMSQGGMGGDLLNRILMMNMFNQQGGGYGGMNPGMMYALMAGGGGENMAAILPFIMGMGGPKGQPGSGMGSGMPGSGGSGSLGGGGGGGGSMGSMGALFPFMALSGA